MVIKVEGGSLKLDILEIQINCLTIPSNYEFINGVVL